MKNQRKNVQDLQKAAKQGQAQFNAKFKEIYGVNYNQQAMDKYMAEPTEANYKKAFGSKVKNIKTGKMEEGEDSLKEILTKDLNNVEEEIHELLVEKDMDNVIREL